MKVFQKQTLLFNTYTIPELALIFATLTEDIQLLRNYASLDLLPVNGIILQYNRRLQAHIRSCSTAKTVEIIKDCNKDIHQIIIHVQTHDIISQKLQHIEMIHKAICNEILSLGPNSDLSQTDYISVILEIIIMNREQLMMLKKEFTDAADSIKARLYDLELKTFKLTNLPSNLEKLFSSRIKFEKLTEHISIYLLNMAHQINSHSIKTANKEEKLKSTASIFTMESEREILYRILQGGNVAHLNSTVTKNAELDQTEFF